MQLKQFTQPNSSCIYFYIGGDKYAEFVDYSISHFKFLVPNHHMAPLFIWMSRQVNPLCKDVIQELERTGWTKR